MSYFCQVVSEESEFFGTGMPTINLAVWKLKNFTHFLLAFASPDNSWLASGQGNPRNLLKTIGVVIDKSRD
jgi:hypothetical protein